MIRPLCVVTGFLGSGKTTLLRRIAAAQAHREIVYLVNEFSRQDIDGGVLARETPDVLRLAGGSLFCSCKATELLRVLRDEIPARFPQAEGVVVETSGIADPSQAAGLLGALRLGDAWRVARVIALVDPGAFERVRATLPVADAQVRAADTIALNHADRTSAEVVDRVERVVRALNPTATLVRTTQAGIDIDPFGRAAPGACAAAAGVPKAVAHRASDDVEALAMRPDVPIDLEEMAAWIGAQGDAVLRVKGVVPTVTGLRQVDAAYGRFDASAALAGTEARLVWVFRADAQDAMAACARRFACAG